MQTSKRAKALRRNPSGTERKLWGMLRGKRLGGLHFRRQVPIGPYIVDFLCLRHRLIVEADGPLHDAERDAIRDRWLTGQGFRVMRFQNSDIDANREVLSRILDSIAVPKMDGEI